MNAFKFELKDEIAAELRRLASIQQRSESDIVCEALTAYLRTAQPPLNGQEHGIEKAREVALIDLPFDETAKPIWKEIEEIAARIPKEEWDKIPIDAAENLDHYLYGHPRKS
jgi:predicted transcriptional regulator